MDAITNSSYWPSLIVGLALFLPVWFLLRSNRTPLLKPIYVPVPKEASPHWKPDILLEKPSIQAKDPAFLTCFDPATGGLLGTLRKNTKEEVDQAVQKARLAQLLWSQTSFETRRAVLLALSKFILEHQHDIAAVASRDSGKTFVDAFFGEILTTLEKIQWVCQQGEAVLQPEYRSVGTLTMHKLARVEYVPLGVVAAIVSWNYPFHNAYGPIISALFTGNAIVIKCSEYVAWSTKTYYEPLIKACLRAYGQPEDLVQFLIGEGDIGEALVRSGVDKVTFIGSPGVGKLVMRAASDRLTPVVLELGGKDAAILCDDADLDQAVPIIMRGTYQNMGQNCIGLERIVIHESIHDQFIERVKPLVQALRQGPPLEEGIDCGAMTMPKQLEHIQSLVDDAVKQGARLVCGGRIAIHPNSRGQFFEPTVLCDVKPFMRIAQEEVFGPVMTILKFKNDREALDLVNSSPYGLGGSVFSQDLERAQRLGRAVQSGMMNINDFAVNYLCQSLPFGGVKSSGFGRFAGIEGLRGECAVRAVTMDRVGWIKTQIPPVLDYPIQSQQSQRFCEGLARMVYASSWSERGQGLFQVVKVAVFGRS